MAEPNDYTVLVNVCAAVRNKGADAAAAEIAQYRAEVESAARADERRSVLAEVDAFWNERYVGGPHVYKADAEDWRELRARLSGEEYRRSVEGEGGPR
jgi:hypothetical protein